MKTVSITDIGFKNKCFWRNFFRTNFPNAYDEDKDLCVDDIINNSVSEKTMCKDLEWWDEFTQYYEGVLDETDGYLDDPTTLKTALNDKDTLKIEFHPGDIIYFINDEKIGCTGPHWELWTIPYKEIEELPEQLFLLLLPMTCIEDDETECAKAKIQSMLQKIFRKKICKSLAGCIVSGLIKE